MTPEDQRQLRRLASLLDRFVLRRGACLEAAQLARLQDAYEALTDVAGQAAPPAPTLLQV